MRPALLILAALVLVPAAARAETAASDSRAVEIADRVMKALGGKQRWDDVRGLRWSFGAEVHDSVRWSRRHAWDKYTGMHRVEGVNRRGQKYVIVHKVGETTGSAWMDGQPIEGDSLAKLVKLGQSLWVNDTYWMLMPYKLRDPGVTLKYDGEVQDGDRTFDKLALSFENVGETPGDRYWVYVNRANDRVERWEKILQGDQAPAVPDTWEGWKETGGLWFPTMHMRGEQNLFTRDVEVTGPFPPGTFTAP